MSTVQTEAANETRIVGGRTEYTQEEFLRVAKSYADVAKVINAIVAVMSRKNSVMGSLDDVIGHVSDAWESLEDMRERGSGYTPDDPRFGRLNAAEIAGDLTGNRASIAAVRAAFASAGGVVGKSKKSA